jgi:hypothetical protein
MAWGRPRAFHSRSCAWPRQRAACPDSGGMSADAASLPEPAPSPQQPALTLRDPADILAAVPYLIGFVPQESIVVVALQGDLVQLQCRMDFPDPRDVAVVLDHLAETVGRHQPTNVLVVTYRRQDGQPSRTDRRVHDALTGRFEARGIRVRESLLVRRDRWFSLMCDSPTCCPPEGRPVPSVPRVAAELVGRGLSFATDRAELERELSPVLGPARVAVDQATEEVEQEWLVRCRAGDLDAFTQVADEALATWRSVLGQRSATHRAGDPRGAGPALSAHDVARLTVPLVDVHLRDAAIAAVEEVEPEVGLPLLVELVRRAHHDYVAPPAAMLAWLRWSAGDGGRANVAIDVALARCPGYRLAELVATAICHGVRFPATTGLDADAVLQRAAKARRDLRGGRAL